MENKCPFCGSELPEEASFCLKCFTSLKPAIDTDKDNKKPFAFFTWLKAHSKRVFGGVAAALAFILIMGICVASMKSTNSAPKPQAIDTTIIVEETQYVPVTEAGGVAVTDKDGEQVTDVVEVTKIETVTVLTTEKQGLLDKIFNSGTSKNDKTSGSGKTNETTEKKGFLNQIVDSVFGDDEKETTPPSTSTITNVEHGTTERPTPTTEPSTTIPHSAPTAPATTEKPTQATTAGTTQTTAVATTESGSYSFEYTAQYASKPDGNIKLTKYIGNASVVTIPSFINGRKVAAIATDCFIGDSKIKEINFDDSTSNTISLNQHCFNNLSSLKKVVFNNKSIQIDGLFAYNCPIIYLGKDGKTDNKLIDGAYYKGSTFLWFTAHPSYTTLTFPDWCTKIDNAHNLGEVSNLKVLNIHKGVLNIPRTPLAYGKGLKEINVASGHPEVFSSEGVLFYKWMTSSKMYSSIYPYYKTDKVYKLPEGCYLSIGSSSTVTVNPYLEELWLPSTACLQSPDAKYFYEICYPNLKKIYIAPNHSQYDKIAKTFKGELIVTEF